MEQLGRYLIAGEIAANDFASVHRAYLVTGGGVARPVTLKRLLPALAADLDTISLIVEEGRITAQLEHPGIISMIDLDRADNTWFLVTERVLGRDLATVVAKAKERGVAVDVNAAMFVTMQILAALSHAHERTDARGDLLGIVHRDVCPANVLVSYSGEVKITGFAYAKIRGRAGGTHPRIEPRYGYMSPEQALGSDVDHRADVFGAGLILYEMLSGAPAYEARSLHEKMLAAQRGRMRPILEAAPSVPPELALVVDRALAFDRRGRHASASVFRDELAKVLYQRDATYGAHRLLSFMARVLGDEAFDDRLTEATERAELESEAAAAGPVRAGSFARRAAAGVAASPPAATPTVPLPAMPPPPQAKSGSRPDVPLPVPPPLAEAPTTAAPPPTSRSSASAIRPADLRAASSAPPADSPVERMRSITDTKFDPELERAAGALAAPQAPPAPLAPTGQLVTSSQAAAIASAPKPSGSSPGLSAAAKTGATIDPLALVLGASAPAAPAMPAMLPSTSSTFAASATTIAPEPSPPLAPFETRRPPIGKIALGLVLAIGVGVGIFAVSSERNMRLVQRKLRAAFVGRHPGGLLTIESLPPGARVYLDEDDTKRKTPLTVENLESEVIHDIRLELEGENPVTSTVAIKAGEKRTVTLLFPDAVVSLSVVTDPPGAELWIDNRSIALTPTTMMLRVNKETNIRLTRVGYVEHVETVVPERGKPININFKMEKTQEMLEQEALEAEALQAAEAEAGSAATDEPEETAPRKKKKRR